MRFVEDVVSGETGFQSIKIGDGVIIVSDADQEKVLQLQCRGVKFVVFEQIPSNFSFDEIDKIIFPCQTVTFRQLRQNVLLRCKLLLFSKYFHEQSNRFFVFSLHLQPSCNKKSFIQIKACRSRGTLPYHMHCFCQAGVHC